MQPLSKTKRRLYLFGLIFLFLALFPVVIFFADGYRYRIGVGVVQTGGIFISSPYSDATASMNGDVIGKSNFLQRSFYIDNLTPGTYTIIVERKGSLPWIRALYVEPQLVTDARVVFVPTRVTPVRLSSEAGLATSTRTVAADKFVSFRTAFGQKVATTTAGSVRGEVLAIDNGNISERHVSAEALPSSKFCIQPSFCLSEIPIEKGDEEATAADYFAGGVVYATKEGGVFFRESDIRVSPAFITLYPKEGAEFRIIDDELIVKDGTNFYEIVGL